MTSSMIRWMLLLVVTFCETPSAFAADAPPHVLFMIGEDGYDSAQTLPAFAEEHLKPRGIRSTFAIADAQNPNDFEGLDQLPGADLLVMCVRRRTPPEAQMRLIREHLKAGKPLVALRPSSHAFALRKGEPPAGHVQWPDFDAQVLGVRYAFDHGNRDQYVTRIAEGAADHPILRGVGNFELHSPGPMYKQTDMAMDTTVLLRGTATDRAEQAVTEPIAWTRTVHGSRIFYTSLGHQRDFDSPQFNKLLLNAMLWALERP